jgi:hypothetical protein
MKKKITEALDSFTFLLFMGMVVLAAIIYLIYLAGYAAYATLTGQRHLMNDWKIP